MSTVPKDGDPKDVDPKDVQDPKDTAMTNNISASAALLQRPIPADALHERTVQLAAPMPQKTGQSDVCSVLVFRLGAEWFALSAGLCRQVISPLTAHILPHRSTDTLLGVVNVRGQMLLKVSFFDLLGLSSVASSERTRSENNRANAAERTAENSTAAKVYPRMVVIEKALPAGGSDVWVFDVDELDGIHPIAFDAMESPAAGVQTSTATCTRRVFLWQNRRVSLLDDTRLFDTLRHRAL